MKKTDLLRAELGRDFSSITAARREKLETLADYITDKFRNGQRPALLIICTHNSRRSHLCQILAAFAADCYQLPHIDTYSGGTEATAFNPRAVRALRTAGFRIDCEDESAENPVYKISWGTEQTPLPAFSKVYDSKPNPTENFAAIPVCSEADAGCPIVAGCDFRLALPYDDPKAFDATKEEEFAYLAKITEIGREMFYVMQRVSEKLNC